MSLLLTGLLRHQTVPLKYTRGTTNEARSTTQTNQSTTNKQTNINTKQQHTLFRPVYKHQHKKGETLL